MRKITYLLAVMALFWVGTLQAAVVTTDQYKFLFDGVWTSTIPSSPAITLTSSTALGNSLFNIGSGNALAVTGNSVLFSGGGSGGRGAVLQNLNGGTALSTTKKEIVEFDWFVNTTNADAMAYNAIGLSDASKNPIFVFADEIWNSTVGSGIHFMNLTPTYLAATYFTLNAATYNGASDYKTDCANYFLGSRLGADFPNNKTYHIKAKLDFGTHIIDSIWVTRSDDATKVYLATAVNFLSASATNIDRISALATRGKNQTNSGNGSANSNLNMTVDNFSVYTWELATTTTVIVNYYDADDNSLVTSVTRSNQAVGGTYTATGSDKTSFTNGANYCVFSSATLDNVTITSDGLAHVDLKVKRYPIISGAYSWTGVTDGTWNELNANLSTDGSNSVGYQPGNAIIFPETALNKTVTVNDNFSLGANDLTISGDGYVLQGTGTLTGTGKININLSGSQTATLNVTNNLTGITQIAGGEVTVTKAGALGTSAVVSGATTLKPSVALPATTFNASTTIQPTAASSIAGITAGTGVKVSVTSAINTANATYAFGLPTSGTLSSGSELELNGTGTENKFAITGTTSTTSYLANAKVTLKGAAFLFFDANQGGSSTINIGTLAGENTSKLGWGKSSDLTRSITWSVGSLNENSEYAGTFTNLGGYNTGGAFYTGNYTNLTKVGTGTLTLSGTSTGYNGNLTVSSGEVAITGALQGNNAAAPLANTVTVGAGAKLTVSGSLTATNLALNSDATGTATFVNNGTVAITNPATVQQYLNSARNWYVSIPTTTSTVQPAAFSALNLNSVQYWNEPTAEWKTLASTDYLVPTTGYVAVRSDATPATANATFTGTLNDGDKSISLTRTGTGATAGFNLIGNPYPSYLNLMSAINAAGATVVEPTIWYRTQNSGGTYFFETVNTATGVGTNDSNTGTVTGYVPPMQAVWVRVAEGQTAATLNLTNSLRSHSKTATETGTVATTLMKAKSTAAQQILRLRVTNGTNDNEAILVFNSNANNGLDAYDSQKRSNDNAAIPEIFTTVGSTRLVINGLKSVESVNELPLGFTTGQSNTFTIKATEISNFDANTKIILKDKLLGTEQDLTTESYTFASDVATTTNRFSVVFKTVGVATGTSNVDENQSILVYRNAANQIAVQLHGDISSDAMVSVYNGLGQKLDSKQLTSTSMVIGKQFTSGVYVVTVNNGGKTVTRKVTVN